jgi:uncharacterized protein
MTASTSRGWTITGLLIALLGLPAVVTASRLLAENPKSDGAIVVRELAILALTALLVWIVVRGERRPLSSIQFRTDHLGRTLAGGVGLAIVCSASSCSAWSVSRRSAFTTAKARRSLLP